MQLNLSEFGSSKAMSNEATASSGSVSTAPVKELGLVLALEAAAEYEREQCCKDICGLCRSGKYDVSRNDKWVGYWEHRYFRGDHHCQASPIRERAWRESESR
jgi:hypothetical protein